MKSVPKPEKFRKKPIVVEAIRLKATEEGAQAVIRWINEATRALYLDTTPRGLAIWTREGVVTASDGDWVVKGVEGEFWPVKPSIFKKTYEKV